MSNPEETPPEPSYFETYEFRTAEELQELEGRFRKAHKIIYYRYVYSIADKIIIRYEFADLEAQKKRAGPRIVRGLKELTQDTAIEETNFTLAKAGIIKKLAKSVKLDPDVVIVTLYERGYVIAKKVDEKEGA